jgi:rifampicin phosphotransferase
VTSVDAAPLTPDEVEQRLVAAFGDARATVVEHPDLFARVARTVEEAAVRRRFRRRLAGLVAVFVAANVALALALSDINDRRIVMPWWVIELITNIVLVSIAIALGPFIKRFGRAYAADVFRANPRTGKSYLVLTDVAYYLIFAAFILFTVRFEEARDWADSRGALVQHELARIGGILLIMGILHTANVLALPVIGNLLQGVRPGGGGSDRSRGGDRGSVPPLGAGTWIVRVESARGPAEADTEPGPRRDGRDVIADEGAPSVPSVPSGGRIWVADTEPSSRYPLYTRGNTGEVFPNVLSALGGTLIGDDVGRAQMEVLQEIGFVRRPDLEGVRLGTGVFGGYLYSSGSLARIMGVRTPGMNATTSDQMVFGTVEGVPPYRPARGDRDLLATLKVTRFLLKVLRDPDLAPLDDARADAVAWVASLPDLATASDEALLAFVREYPARLAASMKRLLHFSMIAGGPRALLDKVLDRPGLPPGLGNRLVSGIDDVDSARLAAGQWDLGRLVAADPELMARFDHGLAGLRGRLAGTPFADSLGRFLDEFGHRGNDEYELATPCWAMDPAPVLAAVDRLRHVPGDRSPTAATARLAAARGAAEAEVRRLVRRPLRTLVLRAAAVARAGAVGRERAKDVLVHENLGARLALHELMRRASERGGPADARLGFCVTIDELPAFLADPPAFAEVIAQRSALASSLNEREPPMWFEGRIPDPATWPLRSRPGTGIGAAAEGAELRGIAVSGGTARGRARVISDPGDPRGLEPDEILVCAITDPSWTPLFLVAAGVVCDTGAALSHAAIVARELGIPAVMSVPGITSIPDGSWLEVDGDTGTVRVGAAPTG